MSAHARPTQPPVCGPPWSQAEHSFAPAERPLRHIA